MHLIVRISFYIPLHQQTMRL